MMSGVETRLDGNALIVRIPMRFQRRGGRKRIVAPDGSELASTSKPQPDATLVKLILDSNLVKLEARSADIKKLY
jgi:hypothetical protein